MKLRIFSIFFIFLFIYGLASCDVQLNPDENPRITMPAIPTPEDVNAVLEKIGASEVNELDSEGRAKLQSELSQKGFDVTVDQSGVQVNMPENLPELTTKKSTAAPTTMPKGTEVAPSEVYPLMQRLAAQLEGGVYTIKGRGGLMFPGTNTPFTIVVDGKKSAIEAELDWVKIMKESLENNDFGRSKIQAALFQKTFGNKIRIIESPDKSLFFFPDKKIYIDAGAILDGASFFNPSENIQMFVPEELSKTIPSSKIKVGETEYLCGTINGNDGFVKYFFLDENLKRIEISGNYDSLILELDEVSTTIDQNFFSIGKARSIPLKELETLFSAFEAISN